MTPSCDPAATLDVIRQFLSASRDPVALEAGDLPVALVEGQYQLEVRQGAVFLEAWSGERMFHRRIQAVTRAEPGRLDLKVERFGKKTGGLLLLDRAKPRGASAERREERLVFRERFRWFLARRFAGWRPAILTMEANLEESLSPAYARALVVRGNSGWAAIGSPPESDVDGILTFGLIWLERLRQRERKLTIQGLAVLVPAGASW